MNSYTYVHSLVLLLMVLLRSGYSKNCLGRDQCSCVYDTDSSVVDLSSLGNKDLTPRYVHDLNIEPFFLFRIYLPSLQLKLNVLWLS